MSVHQCSASSSEQALHITGGFTIEKDGYAGKVAGWQSLERYSIKFLHSNHVSEQVRHVTLVSDAQSAPPFLAGLQLG